MIISKKWLAQYLDVSDLTVKEIADKLTNSGLEVEGIKKMSQGTNLVIGYVKECIDHPDSDHLHVCQVNLGSETVQIVCGAPNVAAGQKVIVARVGALLPGGEIKAGMIRGQESNGMICSLLELGVDPHNLSEDSKSGIEVLKDDAIIGNEQPLAYLGLDDEIMDIGLTPNRNDCMAAWSMAMEAGAVLAKDVDLPNIDGAAAIGTATKLKINSETSKCPLFLGKVIQHVTIKSSPKWMQELLMAAGMKSINNIVDISNIVMLETGQPLHFYDIDAIPAQEITVKDGLSDMYTALDGMNYQLNKDDIVITTQGKPIGIAGIMGGDDSKIEATTKGIIMEAAIFNHVAIRNTVRRLNLNTDASTRYQKGIEPMATFKAMDRAVQLLKTYADAAGLEETVQCGSNHYTPIEFDINIERINALLGTDLKNDEAIDVLTRLNLKPETNKDDIRVHIPSYRTDLCIEPDIAEELIRMIGYDRLPGTMPQTTSTLGYLDKRQQLRRNLRHMLSHLGYHEAISYTLVSEQKRKEGLMGFDDVYELASPMSEDHKYIRSSIMPSMLECIAYNQARNMNDIALFEISNVYGKHCVQERLCICASGAIHKNSWQKYHVNADFYTMKGLLEAVLNSLGFDEKRITFKENTNNHTTLHPYRSAEVFLGKTRLGFVGQIHPALAKTYDIHETYAMELNLEVLLENKASKVKYVEISKYPSIARDYALVVQQDVKVSQVTQCIKKNGKLDKEMIIQDIEVFDVYMGEHIQAGYKSIALRVTFQSDHKTLKDKEINALHDKIIDSLKADLKAELRS